MNSHRYDLLFVSAGYYREDQDHCFLIFIIDVISVDMVESQACRFLCKTEILLQLWKALPKHMSILFLKTNDNNLALLVFFLLRVTLGWSHSDTLHSSSNWISDVMVSVLASSVVDRGFKPRSDLTKDYKIGISYFSAKHTSLRRKSNDWLARNQNNGSKMGDTSIHRLLFQWASTINI